MTNRIKYVLITSFSDETIMSWREGLPEDQKPKTQLKDGFKLTKEWYETQGWI